MAKKKISEFPNKATPVNSDLFLIEQSDGTYYNVLKSAIAGTGSVTSVAASISGALSVSGSPITTAGTLAFTWAGTSSQQVLGDGSLETKITDNNQLANGSGYITGVTGTTNRITITGGSTINIAATYVGQSSLTTLGTITTGVWNGTSIVTTYTDAKIKGTIGATNGLIAIGNGTADTVTTLSGFSYTSTTFLANPSTSTQITIGSTATNAMFRLDSVGGRIGNLSTAGAANTVSFQVGTKLFVTDSSSMLQLGTAATGQFQMQTSFFGSGSGVLSTIGTFMGGNGTRGSIAFVPSADLANVGDKVLFAYHTGSAWASAIEYANASAANVVVSIVSAGGQMKVGGSSFFGGTTTPTAFAHLAASTTARSSLRIVNGVAPTSPNNGDIWYDGTDLKMRVSAVTKPFAFTLDVAEQALTATLTITATTAPTGATNHTYAWSQVGKLVNLIVNINFATSGSAVSAISFDLPTDLPTPYIPSSVNGALQSICYGSGTLAGTNKLAVATMGTSAIRLKSLAPNVFDLILQRAAGTYANGYIAIQYLTA